MDFAFARQTACDLATRAGDVVRGFFDQPHQETTKSNIFDVVTEGDKAAEAVIVPGLRAAFPQCAITSEEGMTGLVTDADYTWHIDPIDGTTNFANNIPFFSISIALADRNLHPLVGVVYNPISRELFSAVRGGGAWLHERRLQVSATADLERAVLTSGFPTDRRTNPDNNIAAWNRMLMQVRDLRRFGSAALEMSFIAAGRLDGFWEKHVHSWDVLAGILLVQEAGGQVTDLDGQVSQTALSGAAVVASNGRIHARVLEVLAGKG